MSEHFWGSANAAQAQAHQAQWIFYGAFGLLAGPGALAASWVLSRRRWSWATQAWLLPLAVLWVLVLWTWVGQTSSPGLALTGWWGGLVGASPLGSLLIRLWRRLFEFLRPRDLQESLQEQQQVWERQEEARSRQAAQRVQQPAPIRPGFLNVGVAIKGSPPAYLGLSCHQGWLQMDSGLLSQHLLVLGATGAGKSETLKRVAAESLAVADRDLFFVDGKGDPALGRDMAELIYRAHGRPVPRFVLGGDGPGSLYHGFRGGADAIYNRLCALVGVDEASGDARFYADINRDLLQLICYAPPGPPRAFDELLQRLDPVWLRRAYAHNPLEAATLATLDPQHVAGLLVRLRPLVREFGPLVGARGFVLEQSRGAVFSLRTQSVGDTARRFLHFLVEDVKDFVGKRQRRPGLLIIDEFAAFGNHNIVALLTMARSADLGVVLATQDVAGLGDETTQRLILANTRTKILMASDFPEEIGQLAGTSYQIEASIQHTEGLATGLGSARVQHAFRLDMNELARLQPGEAYVIRQRYAAKVRVKPVEGLRHRAGAHAGGGWPI